MLDLTQLRTPIVLAPMAGGFNTPALAAAVAEGGGVGSFGFAYSAPESIEQCLADTKKLTAGPLNANFFVFSDVNEPAADQYQQAEAAIRALSVVGPFDVQWPTPRFFPDLAAQLEPVWQHRPEVLTFHFGIPNDAIIQRAHELDICVGVTATCMSEALAIGAAGADFVVAQGWEAGGHRGCFDPNKPDDALDTRALTALLTKKVSLPIVAAGGLMNSADVKRVIEQGACAAQLGTAFLACPESGTSPTHRRYLLEESGRETTFTWAFSGRPARGIRNAFMQAMEGQSLLPFPLQNTLTGGLRRWAEASGNYEYQSVWAGTGVSELQELSAGQLMTQLAAGLTAAS
jgi:nitronate monooxygenase